MKIKSLLLSLLLFPVALFGATNSFDNVTVKTSSKFAGVTKMMTNGINGVHVGIFTNGQFGLGPNTVPAAGYLGDFVFSQDDQTKIRLRNPSTGSSASSLFEIVGDGVNGLNMGMVNDNFIGSTPGNTAEIYSGTTVDNFMILSQKAGAQLWIQTSTGRKLSINDTQTTFQGGTPVFATNNNFTVSNLFVNNSTTIGDAASDTITFNAKTAAVPNGLFFDNALYITNNTVSIGTNGISATASLLVQALVTNGPGMIVRGVGSPNPTANIIVFQNAAGSNLSGVQSNGTYFVGGGTFQATGVNAINAGGTVSFINNSAATNSRTDIGGGTGIGSKVTISASSQILGSFSTNVINFNAPVTLGTNSTPINAVISTKFTGFDAPSINTDSTFSTNFALANVTTNGSTMVIMDVSPTAQIVYRAYCPSNGFMKIDLMNNTAGSIDPASQTIGVTHFNIP